MLQAHKNIKKIISERAFQKQAKQDQAEFKLAMQNLLAQQKQLNLQERNQQQLLSAASKAATGKLQQSSKFAFQEEQEKEGSGGDSDGGGETDAVYQVISEQPETDFEDMVASNLV